MKCTTQVVVILLSLSGTASVLAEQQVLPIQPVEAITAEAATTTSPDAPLQSESEQTEETTATDNATASAITGPGKPCPMHDKCLKPAGKGRPCKGKDGGMKDGCRHDKHKQVIERLDLIEARLAKIEAMLESLLRR